jgi:N-acetylglucosaminyldiphosphoundecaprenol N-acetyl-beta-D-mannosaminyltransferase
MIVRANKDKEFKNILNNAQIALTDGMQLFRTASLLGAPLKERIIGTNFVENLCEKVSNRPITVGFLGGRPGVAEKASECLRQKYLGLKIAYAKSEWEESLSVKKVDILFVAFGFPKQEKWMAEYVGKIPVKVMMGVGGALDQIVDPTLRPPAIIHKAGLGWLYRLIREPWRMKRQIKLLEFIQLVEKEKRGNKASKL